MAAKANESRGTDYWILMPAVLLAGFGLVFIYSSSSYLAEHRVGDSYYFLKRQGVFCLIGLFLLILAKNTPARVWEKCAYPLLFLSLGLLVMLLIPGMGRTAGGASRWIGFNGFTFQPSELAKLSLAVYIAYSMAKKGPEMRSFTKGFLPHVLVAGLFMGLIVLQPDLGTAVIIGLWIMMLLFVGGVRVYQIVALLLAFAPLVGYLVWLEPYRLRRWWAFLEPWKDPLGLGFQIIHSFLAFGSGGVFGAGLGNSKQKLLYLPEPHTDFIMSIIAEELGLMGVATIVVLFGVLVIRGIMVALNARDLYSTYLALALSTLIGLQVIINMGVVMGLLPTKGLTLPMISYGGSSLVVNFLAVGILLSVAQRR